MDLNQIAIERLSSIHVYTSQICINDDIVCWIYSNLACSTPAAQTIYKVAPQCTVLGHVQLGQLAYTCTYMNRQVYMYLVVCAYALYKQYM